MVACIAIARMAKMHVRSTGRQGRMSIIFIVIVYLALFVGSVAFQVVLIRLACRCVKIANVGWRRAFSVWVAQTVVNVAFLLILAASVIFGLFPDRRPEMNFAALALLIAILSAFLGVQLICAKWVTRQNGLESHQRRRSHHWALSNQCRFRRR
jgi:hypothetical protein